MDMTTTRKMLRQDGVFSVATRDDTGAQVFVTCEHAYPDGKGNFLPKLQPGKYTCQRGTHYLGPNLTPLETFEVLNVIDAQGAPHHGILFVHPGNWGTDSEGCSVCGDTFAAGANPHDGMKQEEMVTNSRATFAKFMALQAGVNSFTLTVV